MTNINQEYNSNLAGILESTEDAIICKSLDGTIQGWNKGSEKMFGYTSKEMIGKNISLIIPTEFINDDKNNLSRISDNEIVDRYETIRIKKDGEQLFVSLIVYYLKDKAGNITGFYQVARDITSQKKSEAELIEAYKEPAFQNEEKDKRVEELLIANKELVFQNAEKEKRANELMIANEELVFQNEEKQKRAEELLIANLELDLLNKREHALFASIVNSSEDAILSKGLDGIIAGWNYGAEKIFGYSADEIIGKSVSALIPPQLQQEEVDIIKKIKNGETVTNLKSEGIRKDGSSFHASLTISPIRNFDGNVIGASKVLRDITEQNKSEAEKNQLTKRLRLATSSAAMGIWDWDIKNDNMVWDKRMYQIYDINDLRLGSVYEGWLSRLHPEDKDMVNEVMQSAITDKKREYGSQFRIIWDDLSVHYIKGTGITEYDDNGNAIRMMGVNWDITEQKEKEQHLKLLESVIINTSDSVLITEAEPFDEPGPRILYVNDAFTKMTGYSSEEVIGKTPRILQGPKSDKIELQRLGEAIRKWQSFETTIINYKKNGEEFWINFSLTPVANEKGWYTHWIAIERDVTDLKKYISTLESQNIKLREIAWTQSHIVRAPLARMLGIVNLIKDIKPDSSEYDEWVERFTDSASELDDIIKDITVKAQTIQVN